VCPAHNEEYKLKIHSISNGLDVFDEVDNITRLLTLQKNLKDLDYHLDVEKTNVLLHMVASESRSKARAMIPDLLSAYP